MKNCCVDGCTRTAHVNDGPCGMHYQRFRTRGEYGGSEVQRVADKVAWALELLALYEPDALAHRPVQLRLA